MIAPLGVGGPEGPVVDVAASHGHHHSMAYQTALFGFPVNIVTHNSHFPFPPAPVKGDFDLNFPGELSMAPVVSIFVYAILPDGEMIADSAKFEIEKCLRNRVDLSFTPARSLPASQVHLQVTASPQSLCGLRAVDQSVLLLRPEAELSPSWGHPPHLISVLYRLWQFSVLLLSPVEFSVTLLSSWMTFAVQIYNLPEMRHSNFIPSPNQLEDYQLCVWDGNKPSDGEVYLDSDEKDVYTYVEGVGLKAFTNLKIKHRKLCIVYEISTPSTVPAQDYDDVGISEELKIMPILGHKDPPRKDPPPVELAIETIRKYFPETWIWDLVTVNSSGVTEMEVTVPDTITEWKAGAFCLSNDTGLGLSPVVSLQAFQPFFVELTMPYSVIRGEAFTLKATVINYLPTCIRVGVLLEDSPDFTAVPVAKDQDSHCLCANGRHTASWLVTPKSLDAKISEKVSLKLPSKVVEDSVRAHFSVHGDILSSAIKNTQNLLHMPFGCGEQNMVLFAPNIYVLKYLNETQQLTQNIKSKAIGYLTEGYQKELNYKHKDGSYSAFGDQHGQSQGNTWLTAFVLKSFAQARAFIFVDETHITHAFTWLSQQQQDNGCFRSSGSLFNNAMKGGVKDEVTLSAYVTIAFLESSIPDTDTVVALHALSKYGAVTFAGSQKTPSVTIQSSGTFSRTLQIESSNRLLLQQVSLPDIPGDYDISVSGEGCVYAQCNGGEVFLFTTYQTTLRYNVQLEKQESAFTLRVQTVPLTCDNPKGRNSFRISLEISYTGSRPASNMVIVDVKMVSGFIPLKPTVKKLERSEHVSRTEVSTNKVLLYVDQVTNQTLTFSFVIQQDIPVRNLQPAIVKVYDYYETDEVVFAEYSAPCSSEYGKAADLCVSILYLAECSSQI
ncbi:murinoglobulin-1-like protein [Cricetulus griseus]|nr:murinoglobulin-1-like protein [Cricetulus griseus]